MVQILTKPKYPVIEKEPSFANVVSSFRTSDWQVLTAATVLSLPFGYIAGKPVVMRPTMVVAGILGASFGFCYGLQNSFARLTGFKENQIELSKYASTATQPSTNSA